MNLAGGFYATSINVHNPNDEKVYFFKKLALTYPPAEQKAGSVTPVGVDTLGYDEALKTACTDIERTLFDGGFPASYIEGFVIIQSPRSLDVTGVYTTTSVNTSIHVEQIRERERRRPEKERETGKPEKK